MANGYQDYLSSPVFTSRGYLVRFNNTYSVASGAGLTSVGEILVPAILHRVRLTFDAASLATDMYIQSIYDGLSYDPEQVSFFAPTLDAIPAIQPFKCVYYNDDYITYVLESREEMSIRQQFSLLASYIGTGNLQVVTDILYYPVKAT